MSVAAVPTGRTRFPIATVQLPITGDARRNGEQVRQAMREAATGGARLAHFPEGMVSGYAKNPIENWDELDWSVLRDELEAIAALAGELELWVVVGSAHPLTPPHLPHNSLYVVSDQGVLVDRYDKRFLSHTELTRFYSPGRRPVVFAVDAFRFGTAVCIEVNFPQLFAEYELLGVDCLLLSAYPIDQIFQLKARAHAAINNYWLSLSVSSECAGLMTSGVIGPDGQPMSHLSADHASGVVLNTLDPAAPEFDIALHAARPWRSKARQALIYQDRLVHDVRSSLVTSW